MRGVFHLRAVVPLPWAISFSSRADLMATHYWNSQVLAQDPNAGAPLVSIETGKPSTCASKWRGPSRKVSRWGALYILYTSFPEQRFGQLPPADRIAVPWLSSTSDR